MAKVTDCALTSSGELPFDFTSGACNSFPFGILLCFSPDALQAGSAQQCHSCVQTKTLISKLFVD